MQKPRIDIAVISAMKEEIQALVDSMSLVSKEIKGKRTYYRGTLLKKRVVIVFSRWGKVASAATTTQLICDYDIKEIIFTGVGGALKSSLNIGDIVIGKDLYQHDMDTRPLFDQFEIPLLNKQSIGTVENRKLKSAVFQFLSNYNDFIESNEAKAFAIDVPKAIIGDIASGDQFIADKTKKNYIIKKLPTAVCVEMEGAAVAQVCYEYDIPFSIIRIISDKASDNASIDFSRFANSIASHYSLGILNHYLA